MESLINNAQGMAWYTKSNQSKAAIPLAPPAIHLILPHICGSGTKGAKPKVRLRIMTNRQLLMVAFMLLFLYKWVSDLLEERTTKYFKDIYDHILQANDLAENYRDMMMNLHDLYLSNVNLKMNEVMKVMAIVTCLLAPATVIGGMFGMNFDVIPYGHHKWGFYLACVMMIAIPMVMLYLFRKRGWF